MNSADLFQFSATADGQMADFARLTLYDGFLRSVADGYYRLNCRVPAGLYKLTIKLNEAYAEKFISVEADTTQYIDTPQSASSLLVPGFKNSSGYYRENAAHYSNKPTTNKNATGPAESIFLFFRYPDADAFRKYNTAGQRLSEGFKLLDSKRKIISEFSQQEVAEDMADAGWMAFHAKLAPGPYYLYYAGRRPKPEWEENAGEPPREIPVFIFPNWQTQCYMTFRKGPLFTSMIFSMSHVNPRERERANPEKDLEYLEGILQKFKNGIYYLPDQTLINLAYEKFRNPILGLVAAYAYFKSKKRNKEDFFRIVVRNLTGLFGITSPDMVALNLLAAEHFGEGLIAPVYISSPCMFLPGFSGILGAQTSPSGWVIKPKSIAERAIEKLYYDMVWTSYKPITRITGVEEQRAGRERSTQLYDQVLENIGPELKVEMIRDAGNVKTRKPLILNSWVANSLLFFIDKATEPIQVQQLAAQVQITPYLLEDTAVKIIHNREKITRYLQENEASPASQAFKPANLDKLQSLLHRRLNP